MFNNIKAKLNPPMFMQKMSITSLYKNKGMKNDFNNQRGIFIVSKIKSILDKLIYTDVYPTVDNELSFSNVGGRKGRSVRDHIFIIRSIINDVINGDAEEIDIELFDITKCFDEMGFEETHNDLFDAGVKDDRFTLIARMDEESYVKVKTPCGPTEEFVVKEIIQQGSVFGPLKCSVQIDTIGRDCIIEDECLYKYKNAVRIPPLAMIDDILAVSKCGVESIEVNALINMKIEAKKLRLSEAKCIHIHVGNSCDNCDNNLKVHEKIMKKKHIGTYLGEIITSDGKLDETLNNRRSKGAGIVSQITGIISSVSFGFHFFNISLTLRESMLLNGMLFNCEAWNCITERQFEILEEIDLMLLRKVMKANVKTAKESFYLETGCLPVRFVIAKRRLMFLWNILKRDKKELIRKVYEAQKNDGIESDWSETVRKDKI